MACAPTSTALRNAAIEFSGNAALYPRCAIACGSRIVDSAVLPAAVKAANGVVASKFKSVLTQHPGIGRLPAKFS